MFKQVGEFGGDNRAGINRCLHRISCIRNRDGQIVGLTCRVGRSVAGSASMAADVVLSGRSILLLGRPGVGKTTAIRDISSMLAEGAHKRVVIIDTSNEIAGDGDVPHPGIASARRMQVPHCAAPVCLSSPTASVMLNQARWVVMIYINIAIRISI